jgi:hypothetical protein
MIASVIRIRRKSWGTNRSGCPLASVSPVPARAVVISSRTAGPAMGPVLAAEPTLEQQRHRRVPDPFVVVVGDHEGDRAAIVADSADDCRQHVGQFGADHQQPFDVGLGRRDLQQRDEFAGGRQRVVDQAVVGEFTEFLDAGVFSWGQPATWCSGLGVSPLPVS